MFDAAMSAHEIPTDDRWFVYLLSATDCSAFKVGFSCNPLQRIYSFSHRYFEHFDLAASRLLSVGTCDTAREIEAFIKHIFREFRGACPLWVLPQAGGETEWFSAVYFEDATAQLASKTNPGEPLLEVEELIRQQLVTVRSFFEHWAVAQASSILQARSSLQRKLAAVERRTLRDWIDAYRHFGIPIFADDDEARRLMSSIAARAYA